MSVPSELKYTKSHEWVRIDGDTVTIGITDHAQSELGDVVYVELPEVGRVLGGGDSFGSVESVKAVSDIYSPVDGEVTESNGSLGAQSELVNSDPYGDGWLIKVRVSDSEQVKELMDSAAYSALLG